MLLADLVPVLKICLTTSGSLIPLLGVLGFTIGVLPRYGVSFIFFNLLYCIQERVCMINSVINEVEKMVLVGSLLCSSLYLESIDLIWAGLICLIPLGFSKDHCF